MALYKVRVRLPGTTAWKVISEFDKNGKIVAFPDQELTVWEAKELKEQLLAQRPDCEFTSTPIES